MHLAPTLADAWDDVLTRKAEESSGFQPPPLTSSLAPLDSQKVIVTGARFPTPTPFPTIRIEPIRATRMPVLDPWETITARRAAGSSDWRSWVPYAVAALAVLAVATMPKKGARRVTPKR